MSSVEEESLELRRNEKILPELALTWSGVNVKTYPQKKLFGSSKLVEERKILNNVTGMLEGGTLTAIMGSSGAGKSTLLDVISTQPHIRRQLQVEGIITLNGETLGPENGKDVIGYVEQYDRWLPPFLTVKEHLRFQAGLKLKNQSLQEETVSKLIVQMGLTKCENNRILAISGGQKKRVSVATIMIGSPLVILLDEPTSGLDSFSSEIVIKSAKDLTDLGHIVICTIHTPSSQLYYLFDNLIMIANGEVAYHGPTNYAVEYFADLGFKCPPTSNPADFIIDILAVVPGEEEDKLKRIKKIAQDFKESNLMVEMKRKLDETVDGAAKIKGGASIISTEKDEESPYKASWLIQIYWLIWRTTLLKLRNPRITIVRIITLLCIALTFGLTLLDVSYDSEGIQSLSGCLFLFALCTIFNAFGGSMEEMMETIPTFLKENFTHLYRINAFYLSLIIVEIPVDAILYLPAIPVFYYMGDYNPLVERFFMCLFLFLVQEFISASAGHLLACTGSNNIKAMMAIFQGITLFISMLGGFYISITSIPVYIAWINYLSWFRYVTELLFINQWSGITDLECSGNSSICLSTGTEVIESYGYDQANYYSDFWALGGLAVGSRLLVYLILVWKAYRFSHVK